METRDWSLVAFTLLSQAAVGAFLTLLVLWRLAARRGAEGGAGARWGPLAAVLAVLSAGLVAALFHLSTPLQAARAVVNFSSSWLSREIVFGGLFAAGLAVMTLRARRAQPAPRADGWLAGATAAAGLTFLGCQIAIYLLPAQPAWNGPATPAAFGAAALRLGILGVAAGLAAHGPSAADPTGARRKTVRGLALAGLAALAAELVILPLLLATLVADGSAAATASAGRLTGDYGGILALRIALLCAAAAALAGVARHGAHEARRRLTAALACASLAAVVLSELCGRFLFYAMRVRVGI